MIDETSLAQLTIFILWGMNSKLSTIDLADRAEIRILTWQKFTTS